ncbi:hypothetical protein P8625_05775 [Tenacibaculum tangerinum]|uniref:Lipoprotein n=1 Tax=Tenacibaculum tangerinum TaxID=3038772 RepID=A0ABY8L6D5_9FLAO|nr:hypothetical protein [Tenacibaculum tangerinum]WGH76666.1 hypothetical protein P8625_05775 [Tenacibaculum tangerinum]
MIYNHIIRLYKLAFILLLSTLLYACPAAKSYPYKLVNHNDQNNIVVYQNDSIKINVHYIHFYTTSYTNLLYGEIEFLSDSTINKNGYTISLTSKNFGEIPSTKTTNSYYSPEIYRQKNLKKDTTNLFFFQLNLKHKKSIKKLKKDTVDVHINNKSYKFIPSR